MQVNLLTWFSQSSHTNVSNHLRNPERWSWLFTRMSSRKWPRDETIKGGRLRRLQHKARDMLMVTTCNTSIVAIILNNLLLAITKEVHKYTSQPTISSYATGYYSKFDQEVNAWVVTYENQETKKETSWSFTKVVMIAYGNGCLQEPLITEFKWQYKRGFTMLVVTRAGCLREWSQGELRLHDFSYLL